MDYIPLFVYKNNILLLEDGQYIKSVINYEYEKNITR